MADKKNTYRRNRQPTEPDYPNQNPADQRPFKTIEDEFARRDVVNDDFTGNRGMDDASFRYIGSASRLRDFLQSKITNPELREDE